MKSSIRYQHIAHYSTSHVINRDEKEIIIALHGYGQLAEFFIKKFEPLYREDRLIVVPEATNYAYAKGFSGKVGANWMTRHERESAIENNHNYLNSLLNTLLIKYTIKPTIKILGFSQGAATATRWVSQLNAPVKSLVLWAGGFAHDLDFEEIGEKLTETEVLFVIGDSDELITPESISKQDELISMLSCKVKKLQFKGGHELDLPLLKKIFDH